MFLDELNSQSITPLSRETDMGKIKLIVTYLLWDWYYHNINGSVKVRWKILNLTLSIRSLRPFIELLAGHDPLEVAHSE